MKAWFVNFGGPWFIRSVLYNRGDGTGVFGFYGTYGSTHATVSFRVVPYYVFK